MDAPTPDTIQAMAQLSDSFGQLRTGALIALVTLAAMGLAAFSAWLWSRSADRRHALLVMEREQKAKAERAQKYEDAWDRVSKRLERVSKESGDRVIQIADDTRKGLSEIQKTLETQASSLKYLADSSRGVIRADEGCRIVEDYMIKVMCPELIRIAMQSLEKNHYRDREDYVKERVTRALRKVVLDTSSVLTERFSLPFKVHPFFAYDTATGYVLVQQVWEVVEKAHETRQWVAKQTETASFGSAVRQAVEHVGYRIEEICRKAYQLGADKALDIYRDDCASTGYHRIPSQEFAT